MSAYGTCPKFEKGSFLACSTCPHFKRSSCTGGDALLQRVGASRVYDPEGVTEGVVFEVLRNGPATLWMKRYGLFDLYKRLVREHAKTDALDKRLAEFGDTLTEDDLSRLRTYVGYGMGILGFQSNVFAAVVQDRYHENQINYGIITGNTRTFRSNGAPWITWVPGRVLRGALAGVEDDIYGLRFGRGRTTKAPLARMRKWAQDKYTVLV